MILEKYIGLFLSKHTCFIKVSYQLYEYLSAKFSHLQIVWQRAVTATALRIYVHETSASSGEQGEWTSQSGCGGNKYGQRGMILSVSICTSTGTC